MQVHNSSLLAEQVERVKDIIQVTSTGGEYVASELGLQGSRLSREAILDVGSGASTFVLWANSIGAQACGLDVGYADIDKLNAEAEESVRKTAAQIGNLRLSRGEIDLQPPSVDTEANIFRVDAETNPGRYIAGSAVALPFANRSFDRVINFNFLTVAAGRFEDFTVASILEAMRVLRPRGVLNLGVLHSRWPDPTNRVMDEAVRETHLMCEANIRTAYEQAQKLKLADKFSRFNVKGSIPGVSFAITRPGK